MIRDARADDAASLAAIYNPYIEHTIVTFETTAIDAAEMARRLAEVVAAHFAWLMLEVDGAVQGYAYASAWKGRCAYRHSAEVTVYLRDGLARRGYGRQLYTALIERLRAKGLHALIGGIALPNAASVGLHEAFGFEKVAHFREVGRKFERWIDVGYWELLLKPSALDVASASSAPVSCASTNAGTSPG